MPPPTHPLSQAVDFALKQEMYGKPKKAIIVHGSRELSADEHPVIKAVKEMRGLQRLTSVRSGADLRTPKGTVTARAGVASLRSTSISLDSIVGPITRPRSTKIICTLGPKCSSEEGLSALIDAGMNIARFNFSHGDHESHGAVLQRYREVCDRKRGAWWCCRGGALDWTRSNLSLSPAAAQSRLPPALRLCVWGFGVWPWLTRSHCVFVVPASIRIRS